MFLFTLVFSCTLSIAFGFCPSGCQCDENELSVKCLGVRINIVPILLNPRLKKLNLAYNRIVDVEAAFEFYEWLEVLDLTHNHISSLGERNFREQLELVELKLGHNNIDNLKPSTFTALSALQVLDLSHNQLSGLPNSFLISSPKLRILILSNNQLLSITPKAFKGLSSLNSLDLCDNAFRRVPGASLEYVGATLETFQICRNKVVGLQPDDFPTPNLKALSVEGNKIAFVDPTSFFQATQIQTINLNNNLLKAIPTPSFSTLKNLVSLSFSYNNLTAITSSSFIGLNRLYSLDISGCPKLTTLSSEALSPCRNLRTLTLSRNPNLSHLPNLLLASLAHLTSLDISGNNLKTVHELDFPWASLKSLDLRGNPLVCNCTLRWLKGLLLSANSSINLPLVVCSSPEELRGILLSRVSDNNLSCFDQFHLFLAISATGTVSVLVICLTFICCRDRLFRPGWQSIKHMQL